MTTMTVTMLSCGRLVVVHILGVSRGMNFAGQLSALLAVSHGKLIMLNLIWLRKITVNKEFLRPGRIMRDRVAFISL